MVDGILNIYKEKGWTSFDCVAKLRGILKMKKIGHGGTLDPMVTGVLPVALGKATRLLEYMEEAGKVYSGEVTLGIATETEDSEGAVIERTPINGNAGTLSEKTVDAAMNTFIGKIQQVPPMYSAVKVNGKRLYEYAREGKIIERTAREVTIQSFRRTSDIKVEKECARFNFEVACSKGTYVRTLCVDLARYLGFAGHMSQLTRVMASGLTLNKALRLVQVEEAVKADKLADILLPLDVALSALTRVDVTADDWHEVSDGKSLDFPDAVSGEKYALFFDNQAVAVYNGGDGFLKAEKVLR